MSECGKRSGARIGKYSEFSLVNNWAAAARDNLFDLSHYLAAGVGIVAGVSSGCWLL